MPPFRSEFFEDEELIMEPRSFCQTRCCATPNSSPKSKRLISRGATPKSTPPRPNSSNIITPNPRLNSSMCNFHLSDPRQNASATRPCVRQINACELFHKFDGCRARPKPSIIILDSRPFTEFTKRHIQGAFNVLLNPMRRRRLLDGKMSVADMISCEKGRLQLKNGTVHEVVLYDEDSTTLDNIPANSTVKCLVTSLQKEATISVFLLKGGMKEFEIQYRDLCNIGNDVNVKKFDSQGVLATPLLEHVDTCFLRATKDGPGQPSQIVPCIYIGGNREAADLETLQKNNIGYVLNVTTNLDNYHEHTSNIKYRRIPVRDDASANLALYFDEAFEFIDLALKNNSGILIHCQAGISRSPTVTIAYIMKKNQQHMTMSQAYTLVKNRRSVISPNLHFVGQLATFEKYLKSTARTNEQKRCALLSRSSTPVESAV